MATFRSVSLLLALVLVQVSLAIAWEAGAQVYSAKCMAHVQGEPSCSVVLGEDPEAQACGTWQDDIQKTGWGRLLVKTASSEPGLPAFAAGYLEGYLTASRVAQHFNNSFQGAKISPPPAGMEDFLSATDKWWQQAMQAADPQDSYWRTTRFISDQLDGLVAGVNAGLQGQRRFSRLDLLTLNSFWDLGDINKAVGATQFASFEDMAPEALALYVRQHGHCSSVVKLLPDGSELFAGHNTWFEYYHLLRVFKRYEFGPKTSIAMSSYPGMLSSSDDFYQVGHLVVMETTLPNYNNDLFSLIKPETLPFWIRAMTANTLATSGPEWMESFQRHNSGTYNNMWMVVDYSKFTPGKPLPEGVLTVGEQIPGYFHYEDQTKTLSYGYWPSYNAALYPETAHRIRQDVMERTKGDKFSYQLVERAQIFRRDQASIMSDADMQRVMRYNQFQTDPIAHGDSCSQLACRADLAAEPVMRRAFGAIDAKYTSSAHNRLGQSVIVAGPTNDDQPAFDWRLVPELAAATPHAGQPDRFDFGWLVVGPDMAATPWQSSSDSDRSFSSTSVGLAAAMPAAALLAASAVIFIIRQKKARETSDGLPDTFYKNLQPSPASTKCPSTPATPWLVPSPLSSA